MNERKKMWRPKPLPRSQNDERPGKVSNQGYVTVDGALVRLHIPISEESYGCHMDS